MLAQTLFLEHNRIVKTLTISEAKKNLEKVADRALEGEAVFIKRKTKLLALLPCLPVAPPDYFRDDYGPEEIRESNTLAAQAPKGIIP